MMNEYPGDNTQVRGRNKVAELTSVVYAIQCHLKFMNIKHITHDVVHLLRPSSDCARPSIGPYASPSLRLHPILVRGRVDVGPGNQIASVRPKNPSVDHNPGVCHPGHHPTSDLHIDPVGVPKRCVLPWSLSCCTHHCIRHRVR